jgi:hypothetical protein
MKRRTAAAAVVAVLLVTGCGSADKPATAGPSARALAGRLVAAGDLGPGWSVVSPPEDYGTVGVVTDKNRGMVPKLQFCTKASSASRTAADRLEWEAFTQFNYETGNDRHLVFVQEFLRSDRASRTRATYDLLAGGMRACTGERSEYPDGEVGVQSPLQVPAIGEDRAGTRERVSEPGDRPATWDIRSVIARDGTVLIGVTVVEIVSPGQQPVLDDAHVSALMTTIADKAS